MHDKQSIHLDSASKPVKKSISRKIRSINITLFVIVTSVICFNMFAILQNITNDVSKDYARLYADNAVSVLNTYLTREIALISKTAQSAAITEWFSDDRNEEKKLAAYNEIMSTLSVSSGKNIYIGISKTLCEFTIENDYTFDDMQSHSVLSSDLDKDDWYFECMSDPKEYILNVDIDKVYNQKRVWLNYKVADGDTIYGVICTALEFSQVAEELFSEYGTNGVRSLIIDENGYIQMDSLWLGDDDFLHTLDTYKITDEFSDVTLVGALANYIKPMDYYYTADSETMVLELDDKTYQYATIAPITATTWSVVTLYNSSALFDLHKLIPLFIIIPVIFIGFILLINGAISRLVLSPFKRLVESIERVNQNFGERVYGLDRNDEIGELANTIQDMKDSLIDALSKVHYDSLTKIYNRRYYDENILKIIDGLSRSNHCLSVLLLDIDHFKNYNDTYGHSTGDECLKRVASMLSECVTRSGDFVARYGGEEFAVVLPNTDSHGACVVAQKILDSFKDAQIPHSSSNVEKYVTVSIGISTILVDKYSTPEENILRADKALYQSKENGRNRFTLYTE